MGRYLFWLILALLVAGCQGETQEATPTSTPTVAATAAAPNYIPIEGTPYRATPLDPPRLGVLTAESEAAQINLRSQPTTQSGSAGSGAAGDEVELHQLAEGEGGYSWYLVKFASSDVEGWVRGDFVDTAAAVDQALEVGEDVCGEDPQAAFFETDTFAIYICQIATGLRYISVNKINQERFITEEVKTSQGTYIAIDGNIQYHLNDVSLAIYQVNNGEYTQILGEPIVRYERID